MKVYILVGVFLAIGIYLLVQRVRCNIAVKDDVSGGEVAEEVKSWCWISLQGANDGI